MTGQDESLAARWRRLEAAVRGLARFWTQALGWKVLSEREREIVIGTDENAPVGMCFLPVTDGSCSETTTLVLSHLPGHGRRPAADICSRGELTRLPGLP